MKNLLVAAIVSLFVSCGQAYVLDFEDLYPGKGYPDYLPEYYHGFKVNNLFGMPKDGYTGSGFDLGTIGYISVTGWGNPSSLSKTTLFSFDRAYVTAAWTTGQNVTFEGWREGNKVHSTTLITSFDQPAWYDFGFSNIDTLWINPGTHETYPNFNHICIDNMTFDSVNPVPEPASMFLLGTGIIGLLGLRRIRRNWVQS